MNNKAFAQACIEASHELYDLLHSEHDKSLYEEVSIGAGGDMSIGFDMQAEAIYVKALSSFGKIDSEESGLIGKGKNTIVIDPIDGSDNLKSRFPYYGASIAYQVKGETVVGVVCNLANGDCHIRCDDDFYMYNMLTKQRSRIIKNLYAKVGIFEKALLNVDKINALREKNLKFRSPGAVALSIANAHYVKYVLFLGTIRRYDVEAALYISKDLYHYVDDNIIIISQFEDVFHDLTEIFLTQR